MLINLTQLLLVEFRLFKHNLKRIVKEFYERNVLEDWSFHIFKQFEETDIVIFHRRICV